MLAREEATASAAHDVTHCLLWHLLKGLGSSMQTLANQHDRVHRVLLLSVTSLPLSLTGLGINVILLLSG